jgi:hypothetical protein
MEFCLRIAALFCFSSALMFAETWSGSLVDSKCFAREERNVNPTDTLTHVDRDVNLEIRFCSPRRGTKSFALIQSDGTIFPLDSAGNAKAVELVQKTGRKSPLHVTIGGEMAGKAIGVDSISRAR